MSEWKSGALGSFAFRVQRDGMVTEGVVVMDSGVHTRDLLEGVALVLPAGQAAFAVILPALG